MNNLNWNQTNIPLYNWTKSLERIVCSYNLPNINGPMIYIGSDYSGTHAKSLYHVISLLVVDIKNSILWEQERQSIRRYYLPSGRKMSFKGLNDRNKIRALSPFLLAADNLNGLSLSFVVNKSVNDLFVNKRNFTSTIKMFGLQSRWNLSSLEIALRVSYLVAFLIGGFSKPDQDIYWISDEDDMFSNRSKILDMQRLLGLFSSATVKHKLGNLGLGTTTLDEGDYFEEDVTAIPDIIAGTISEVATKIAISSNGRVSHLVPALVPYNLSHKSRIICDWIWNPNSNLKKVVAILERFGNGYVISRLDLK